MSQIAQHIAFAQSKGWLAYYQEAAKFYDIPFEILLAKDSRESGLGSYKGLIAKGWIGSDGVSTGISQINKAAHKFALVTNPNDVRAYVAKGAEILRDEINRFKNIRTALAAYNRGGTRIAKALKDRIDPDSITEGGDYAQDILSRSREAAQVLKIVPSPLPGAKANLSIWLVGGIGLAALGVLKMREAS